ncbi:MAG: hypothetical protein IJY24_00415 [Clostridia bacterium]|nr:hypothetical protein [Clostridia bacterium]
MKRVIREGVFETNSSSTHSVSFVRREDSNPDEESSYELHSPLSKLIFLIGLIENARRSERYYDGEEDIIDEIPDLYVDMDEDILPLNSLANICKNLLNAVKDEYMSIEGIDEEEMNKRIAESPFSYEGKCLCRNFFEDDVLDSCTCPFEGYSGIVNSLKLYRLYTKNEFAEYARWFLAPEQKFVLKEYWCGMQLICSGEVY